MAPGLPGLGLGGLFFIFTALLAPAIELVRTTRGQSSLEAWRGVGRQFAIAVVMIVAVELTIRGALFAVTLAGSGEGPSDHGLTVLPLAPLGITTLLLAIVLGGTKALEVCLRVRDRGLPRVSIPAAVFVADRIGSGSGALAAAWLACPPERQGSADGAPSRPNAYSARRGQAQTASRGSPPSPRRSPRSRPGRSPGPGRRARWRRPRPARSRGRTCR